MHPIFALGLPHGWELFGIIGLVVLLFGAEKIPKLARGLGKSMGEFKKAKDEFEKEIHSAANSEEAKALQEKTSGPAPAALNPTIPGSAVPVETELTKKP